MFRSCEVNGAYRYPPNHDVVAHDVGEQHDGGDQCSLKRLRQRARGSGCKGVRVARAVCMLVIMHDVLWWPACEVVWGWNSGMVKAVNTQWVSCLAGLFSAAQGACGPEEVEHPAHIVRLELRMDERRTEE